MPTPPAKKNTIKIGAPTEMAPWPSRLNNSGIKGSMKTLTVATVNKTLASNISVLEINENAPRLIEYWPFKANTVNALTISKKNKINSTSAVRYPWRKRGREVNMPERIDKSTEQAKGEREQGK